MADQEFKLFIGGVADGQFRLHQGPTILVPVYERVKSYVPETDIELARTVPVRYDRYVRYAVGTETNQTQVYLHESLPPDAIIPLLIHGYHRKPDNHAERLETSWSG
jgi:hypothetical protein